MVVEFHTTRLFYFFALSQGLFALTHTSHGRRIEWQEAPWFIAADLLRELGVMRHQHETAPAGVPVILLDSVNKSVFIVFYLYFNFLTVPAI
jgi:hypothetical protein